MSGFTVVTFTSIYGATITITGFEIHNTTFSFYFRPGIYQFWDQIPLLYSFT